MARPKSDIQRKQSGLRLRSDLIKALKHMAIDTEQPFNALVEQAIEDLLRKHGHDVPSATSTSPPAGKQKKTIE